MQTPLREFKRLVYNNMSQFAPITIVEQEKLLNCYFFAIQIIQAKQMSLCINRFSPHYSQLNKCTTVFKYWPI